MGRKRLAVIIALVTVTGAIPVVGAEHLSAGYEDAVGVQAEEDPGGPSVDADAFDRGTQRTDCFEANGSDTDPGQLEDAANADPFCGKLIYHQGEELEQVSPEDQDLRSATNEHDQITIETFDVRTTRAYMLAHEGRLIRNDAGVACQPFCEDNPGGAGDVLWNATHQAGSEAELTEEPEQASDKQHDNRLQLYGADVHTLTARDVLQEAGTHEMNGWYVPGPTRSFVAFLEEEGGDPVTDERLASVVEDLKKDGTLNNAAVPSVCGWTPDADFVGTGDAAQCEVEFEYEGPREDANDDFTDGYKDKCKSPTYVCGAQAGGAWYANFNCICNTLAVEDPFGEANVNDYIRWHWVVAPTLDPECGPREPGFVVDETELGADHAFLAHDVDVYTNPFALQGTDAAHGTTAATKTVSTLAADQSEAALTSLPAIEEDNHVSPPPDVSKDDRVEPNAAEDANPLSDTSQSLTDPALERQLDDPCEQLTTVESEDTIDPWVDIIDGQVVREVTAGENSTVGQQGINVTVQAEPGLYENDDADQDEDNHPGPDLFHTSGNVGFFTDKDDDGEYDTIAGDTASFSQSKIDPKTIEQVGAYPMIWDVRVEETDAGDAFQFNGTAGCVINGNPLTQGAADAGYGAETGLFQAIYLSEPTVFVDEATGETFPYPGGDNIYLLLSHSARQMYDSGIGTALDDQIDDVLTELKAYAGLTDADVVRPGDDLGLDSDYGPQCPERTGGFTQQLSFTHSCQVDCSGDTIVTRYVFDLEDTELGGGSLLPVFTGGDDFTFDNDGIHTWTDVDPFDNDPSRNSEESARPPT